MSICPYCGTQNNPEDRFCAGCGKAMEQFRPGGMNNQITETRYVDPSYYINNTTSNMPNTNGRKKKWLPLVISLSAISVLLVIGAVVAVIVLRSKNTAVPDKTATSTESTADDTQKDPTPSPTPKPFETEFLQMSRH